MSDAGDGVLGSSPPSSVPSDSPVTWHVIIWVLLCLSINSMAQPSSKICGVSSRYRIYLSTSPIIVLGDGICAFVRMVAISMYLRVNLRQCSHLVVSSRSGDAFSRVNNHAQEASSRSWPRWLFFIMGPLPSAIKLASFSGIPWTKTWGMMCAISFVVVELINLASRIIGSPRVPATGLLDNPGAENPDEESSSNSGLLFHNLDKFDRIVYIVSLLAHLCLLIWAIEVLWLAGIDEMVESGLADFLTALITAIALTILVILNLLAWVVGLVWLGLWCTGCLPQKEKPKQLLYRLLKVGALIVIISAFLPHWQTEKKAENTEPISPPPSTWLRNAKTMALAWQFLAAVYSIFFLLLSWICHRWSVVARALLIEHRDQDPSTEEQQQQDEPISGIKTWPIDMGACASLCFFLTNLVACVLWYAFMYNPTGTVNPSWTDVFGK